jgi:hypothetical protein
MRLLALDGYRLSAGALSLQDTDGAVAAALGASFPEVAPFSELSARDEGAVLALAGGADAVLIVASPFGPHNLGNLRAVLSAGAAGRTMLVGEMAAALDFSRGEATGIWDELARTGARTVATPREALLALQEVVPR